jgi:hypothetical protein
MLSRVFENRTYMARLASISEVKVTWSGEFKAAACYLAAWAQDALAAAGVQAKAKLEPASETLKIELAGDGFHAAIHREDDRLVVTVDQFSNCTNLPQPTDYLLMREELGIQRRDPIFESTLSSAARLAVSSASE